MKEEEILRAVLKDSKTGWWEADMTRRMFRMSDFLQNLLRYSTPEVGFDEIKSLIPDAYAKISGPGNCLLQDAHTLKRAIPLIAPDGHRLWLQWKVLNRETTPDGRDVMTGYVQQTELEQSTENGRDRARIDNLLYRLNSISHTLLALLHSDRTRDTVNKILYEVLTMFRGDRAYIIEFDWEKRTHNCTYEVTANGISSEQDRLSSIPMEVFPWWTKHVSQGNSIILSDISDLPSEAAGEHDLLAAQDIKSLLIMPLASRDKVWGYAGIDIVDEHREWTDEDCQWFASLVNIIGLCLDLQRSEQAAQADRAKVHKAHEAIYRNERFLRNIFDNIQVGVELYAPDGTLVDINNKDMEIFGVTREEALGLNFFENPLVPLEAREGVRAGHEQAFRINYPFDRLNGYYTSAKTGFLEIYTTVNMLYDIEGNISNFMLINIDNTEINRAHTRLAEFESSFALVSKLGKMGFCRFDLLERVGSGVPQWYRNLGEHPDTPLNQILGVYNHVDPVDKAAILENIGRVKAGTSDSFNLDLHILNDDGTEKWTRINVVRNPMNNDPSKIEMVCVNYDISELKMTEKNLIEAKNKAEVSDRLKSAFLANMSHEIRTPLNAIVGFSNLLTEAEDPEERRDYLRVVEENNDLLLTLISDILDLSKIEAGTFDFNYGSVDVNQMCEEVVRSLSLKVQGRPVELRFVGPGGPCFILGDKGRLTQVITNFINNAVKFTAEGSITLSYAVEGDQIRFAVADTGSGIDKEHLANIFERFVKLNSFVQGTGLGLSISKSIVEQMGGRIGVESELGKGACFWFTVPMGIPEELPEADAAHPQQVFAPSSARGGRRPVLLIAEDTDSNYLLLSLMLKKEYEVIRAGNGEEAVRLCEQVQPDAVLMDIQMPVMDGLKATRQIRGNGSQVPIIAVTAYAYDRDRQKALEAGCNEYLAKPLTGDTLRQTLRRLLSGE